MQRDMFAAVQCDALQSERCPGAASPMTMLDGRVTMHLCAEHARLLHSDMAEVERVCRRMICDADYLTSRGIA